MRNDKRNIKVQKGDYIEASGDFSNGSAIIGGKGNKITASPASIPSALAGAKNLSPTQRRQQLEKQVAKAYQLIRDCESRLITSSDPREKHRLVDEIHETKQQIELFETELEKYSE
jgi:hypothetical protein